MRVTSLGRYRFQSWRPAVRRFRIALKGWARLLQPFLRGYVRRQVERLQLQPLKAAAEGR